VQVKKLNLTSMCGCGFYCLPRLSLPYLCATYISPTAKPRSEMFPNGGKINDFESEIRLVGWPWVSDSISGICRGIPLQSAPGQRQMCVHCCSCRCCCCSANRIDLIFQSIKLYINCVCDAKYNNNFRG